MKKGSNSLEQPGQQYLDFKLNRVVEIPELQCTLREFIHLPSGAEVMHIANDDPENVFVLSFRTLPDTSNGVAHILEHTVLCGSEKFPIKDPFFSMTRRSLNTYMNALTGSDFTCYPAASQVPKDFYNILDVYLDAVFHPKLDYYSFLQEGHRLEFANPSDPKTPLEYKGIVYNEMLGSLASGRERLRETVMEALFPDISYGINSGGDPKEIVTLSYEELIDFHKKYYHPSRCLFYFYGNIPVEQHLDFLAKHALTGISQLEPLEALPHQPRFSTPKKIEKKYPISPDESPAHKTFMSFGWLTTDILEQEEILALSILEIILLDTDASILKKALLASGQCKSISAYLEHDIQEAPFIITLSGCEPQNADALEKLIFSILQQVVNEGIPLEKVENAIHQLEFYFSEITGEHEPFGLSLFLRAGLLKHHKVHPEQGLTAHSLFNQIRESNLKNPHFFTALIQKYLLNNPHFVRVVMVPDSELSLEEQTEQKEALHIIKESLSKEQETLLIQQTAKLAEIQQEQEEADLDVLPICDITDVPKHVRVFKLERETVGIFDTYHHDCFTNGIVYLNISYPLPQLTPDELPFFRLFTVLITQMGSGGRSYAENLDCIQANTGGLGLGVQFNIHADDCAEFSPTLNVKGKALVRKAETLCSLLFDLITSPDFSDIARIKELLHKHFVVLEESLNSNAIRYAINLSASGLDVSSNIANSWFGLDYFYAIKALVENFEQRAEALVELLQSFQNRLLGLKHPQLIVTCESVAYELLKKNQFYALKNLPQKTFIPFKPDITPIPQHSQALLISAPVAFISKVLKTVPYVHPDSPALNIAAHLCDNVVLHSRIREQGGAYGAGATCNALTGNFYFYSYRDPNIVSTIDAFNESIQTLVAGEFTDQDLDEAKLEIIQKSDAPVAPGNRGMEAYMLLQEGKTTALRQIQRDKMLSLTRQDIIDAVKKHVLPKMEKAATIVFTSKHLVDKENKILEQRGKTPLPARKI